MTRCVSLAALFHTVFGNVGTDEVSLLQHSQVSVHNAPARTAEEEEFLWTIKLNFTKPCTRERFFKDGPKLVTDKDVNLPEWGPKPQDRGIPASNSVECEAFCLQYESCDCFIYDLGKKRCNLKSGCSGKLGRKKAKDFNSCMFQRPPEFMKCTTGPDGEACQNGCTPRGLKPDCLCGGPGRLGPVPGYAGHWCEIKDVCFEKPEGTKCNDGGECKINSKGLMQCQRPCDGKQEGGSCTTGGNAGKCGYSSGGELICIVDPCAGKKSGAACDFGCSAAREPIGKCREDASGKMVCTVETECTTGRGGKPCLNDGVPFRNKKGKCACQCVGGFTGHHCQKAPACTSGPGGSACLNGGVATGKEPNCGCQCKNGFTGGTCQNAPACTTGAHGGVCLNGGVPTGTVPNCGCQCKNGYTGVTCQNAPVCTAGPGNRRCENGGRPTGTAPNCRCQCPHNGMGTYCENPCYNCIKAGQSGHDIGERHGMTLTSCCQWAKQMNAVSINFAGGGCWPSNQGQVDMVWSDRNSDYCDVYRR